MKRPLICLTKTHLLLTIAVRCTPTAYEIVGNDDQHDKFESFAVLYSKQNFKCLEQEF